MLHQTNIYLQQREREMVKAMSVQNVFIFMDYTHRTLQERSGHVISIYLFYSRNSPYTSVLIIIGKNGG